MKLKKHANKIKTRIVSFAAVIALVLCTVLSLGLIMPDRYARAEDGTNPPEAKVDNGIRFVQVAAGYDFAIGLTQDRKLYGWSTKETRNTTNMATLGDYYTYDPTEINVVFRMGPRGNFDWDTTADQGDGTYHTPYTDDKIKSIAATGTSAAFVTEKGYLYTWGKDTYDVPHTEMNNTKTNYLLLREVDEASYSWKVPYIIDYYYYGKAKSDAGFTSKFATEQMIPSGENNPTSLAAGEFNYIFMFIRNYPSESTGDWPTTSGDYYHTYVWGSGLYNTVNTPPQNATGTDPEFNYSYPDSIVFEANSRKIFNTFIPASSTGTVSVVAGGYTVGINNTAADVAGGTSLQLRGRNFITSQGVSETVENEGADNEVTKVNVTKTTNVLNSVSANIQWNNKTVVGALAGGLGNGQNNGSLYGYETEKYYARQVQGELVDSNKRVYNVSNAASVINSDGVSITDSLAPTRYAVALGNDIGYGISGGKLYGWGDNAYGQLAGQSGAKDTPTQLLNTVTNFVSVAAGKQQSKANRAFQGTTASNTLNGTAFAAEAKNDDKYISAALTLDGSIYAWSKGLAPSQPLTYKDYTGDKKEYFTAIYSGYGENLYAVTASGKLVRITTVKDEEGNNVGFEQKVYDKFYSGLPNNDNTLIKNWVVDSNNRIVFNPSAEPTKAKPDPDFDTATFYVWSYDVTSASPQPAEGEEPKVNTVITNGVASGYKPLVSSNRIGDAYRIMGYGDSDQSIPFLSKASLDTSEDASAYSPKFYYINDDQQKTETEMSPIQQSNMFEFAVVNDTNGIGLRIKPLQSSKNRDIRIDFYIARYNNYLKYTGSGANDNAIYYDYEKCSITFRIADTISVKTYDHHITDADGKAKNSNIPLLDPNNPYNTNFSLAVQDVSNGVDKLIQFLTENYDTVNDGFKNAIIEQMELKDAGFPAISKKTLGNLEYYLNSDDLAKYDNVYQFLYTDRDSDRVTVRRSEGVASIMTGKGVAGDIKTISITVSLANRLGSGFTGKSAAEIVKIIYTDFNNKFGLYDFAIDASNNLTFKYDVVMFTATGSTGSIRYTGETSADTQVTDYVTATGQSDSAFASFDSYTLNDYNYSATTGYVSTNKTANRIYSGNYAYVYSQPTLRLKGDLNGPEQVVDVNGQVSGTKNTFTKNFDTPLFVGDSQEIKLDDYVKFATEAYIGFSYKNSATANSLKVFSNQFEDKTGHVSNEDPNSERPGVRVVWLEGNKLTVHPTIASPISLTVAVQRFVNAAKTIYFTQSGKPDKADETIYLTFNFNNVVGFKIEKKSNVNTYLVKDTTTINLFGNNGLIDITSEGGGAVSEGALLALQANASIYDLLTSETVNNNKADSEQLFSAVADNTKITITPKRSGTGTLQFSVNIYDQSISFMFAINVSSKTEMDTVTVKDTLSIPISDLTAAMIESNKFNADVVAGRYKILFNSANKSDTKDAIYFTSDSGDGLPPFVQRVVFEKVDSTDPSLRIVPSNSTVVKRDVYYMHVKFVNTADANYTSYENVPSSSIIEVVIPVVSGKIKLQDEAKNNLVVTIDCRDGHKQNNENWWSTQGTKLNTTATIPLLHLLELAGTEEPQTYKIFLVSTDSSAVQYFQYSIGDAAANIDIAAKDNTPKNFELSVSAYSGTTTTVLTFEVSIKGIVTTLPVMTDDDGVIGYGNIWLYSAAIVFGVLLIIFMIRFIVYIRRRSKQRAIIKRNQELIRLRDRMHGKANAASREQLVKSKLKMEDPKYAKMFNEMRKDKEEDTGVALVNSDLAATADKKSKKNKKKKGSKKTVAELKAELAAKKAAFAATQAAGAQPVNPFATEVPIDSAGFVAPDGGYGAPDGGYGSPDGGFVTPDDGGFVTPDDGGFVTPDADFGAQNIDGNDIIFDASDLGDGNM